MRLKKLRYNIITSIFLQLVTGISGFVITRYILNFFGSDINGLVASITQFLSYIILIEGGVGGVARAAFYKPLAEKNMNEVSVIFDYIQNFFRKIAIFFVIYVVLLSVVFPIFFQGDFQFLFVSSLVMVIGVGTFIRYFFGISYSLLLISDQRQYVVNLSNILATVFNLAFITILIYSNFGIHVIMLVSSMVFIIQPIIYNIYVKRFYEFFVSPKAKDFVLKQRKDGFAHHVSYFLHNNTDIFVLTIFTNFLTVSVYSVHKLVMMMISRIVKIFTGSIEATFGNIINNPKKHLKERFIQFDLFISIIILTIVVTTIITINPFIMLYTKGIDDVNYVRPYFAFTIIVAELFYFMRLSYQSVVLASGKFKETKNAAFIEAIINITLSILLVNFIGLLGVAVATLIAMMFRYCHYSWFASKYVLQISYLYTFKRFFINASFITASLYVYFIFPFHSISRLIDWIFIASLTFVLSLSIIAAIHWVLYRSTFKKLIKTLISAVK